MLRRLPAALELHRVREADRLEDLPGVVDLRHARRARRASRAGPSSGGGRARRASAARRRPRPARPGARRTGSARGLARSARRRCARGPWGSPPCPPPGSRTRRRGRLHRAVRRLDPQHVAGLDAQAPRGLRGHLDPAPVDHLGHRIGGLVEPHLVGAAPVVVARGGDDQEGGVDSRPRRGRARAGASFSAERRLEGDLGDGHVRPVARHGGAPPPRTSRTAPSGPRSWPSPARRRAGGRRTSSPGRRPSPSPGTSARPVSSRRSPVAFVSTPGNDSGAFWPSASRTAFSCGRSSTSGLVSPIFGTGPMAGCMSPQTPSRGEWSPQDSSGVRSGMTRWARAVVSSRWLDRLTTNGTLASASANPAFAGSVNAGFASFTMRTAISPWAMARASATRPRSGSPARAWSSARSGPSGRRCRGRS